MRRLLSALAAIALAAVSPTGLPGQSSPQAAAPATDRAAAEREVLATIDTFLTGLRTKDTALMARQMDSLTRFMLLRPGPAGARVMLLTPAQFMNAVSRPGQPALDEPIRNPVVHIEADLA